MVKTACVTINVISVQPEIKGETEVCEQETGVIYTTDPTGNHFSWSMNGLVPGDITPLPGDYMLAVDFGAGSGTNTINVIETTSDTYQCTGTASLTVTIHPKPNPMIDDSKGNPVCQWATGVPYSVAWNQDHSYTWNISSQYGNFVDNDSTHHEVKVNWIDSGEAGLTLTEETKFGCINTAYTTITINPAPTPEIMGPDAICEDETTIHTTQNYPDHSYVWDTLSPFPGDVLTNLLTNQITVSWKRAGAAQMTVKETIDDTKCSAVSMPFTTVVNARPKLSLLAETLSVCQGDSVFVELDGGDEYLWLEGQHISWIPETSSWWLFPDEAMHYLVQGTLAATGCADTLSWNVDIRPYPIIDLGGDQYIEPGETITLDAGEGFDQYLWNTGSTGQTLDVTSAGLYEVRVGLKNCEAQDSVRIKMPVSLLPIPNAFSPNSDGENDTFGLIGYPEEITWFNMQIFNRWGAKIFETTDPFQHWDGTYQGILCDTGTYLWIISLEEKSLGQSITKRGYVTLLR
ncbi:MAG: gliding motility-associated C-terminal domain-containing protein [Bacteroidales bacterium]|nr:gliding motility-associated C-terminal domain-containing protein [Bacteroidales bacterium]